MSAEEIVVVRVYLTEGEGALEELIAYLHDESRVRGMTVFRGITGFGRSGRMHSSMLLDTALDLPLVVEFFDAPGRIAEILDGLGRRVDPDHIISWPARVGVSRR